MKKILSIFLSICFILISITPVVDASVRIRKWRLNQLNTDYAPYYQPVQNYTYQQINQNPGNTYYFSPNYVSGYTYYSWPTPGYYLYSTNPVNTVVNIQEGKYYFSPTFIQGYTYYSTPTSWYYYYLPTTVVSSYNNTYNNTPNYNHYPYNNANMICTIINGNYRCANSSYGSMYSTYPGCSSPDIVIGGQIWASCNALDRNEGSTTKSGWFFAGDREASFVAYNANNTALEWMWKQTRESSWNKWPCATGYRLPNRGEWETLQSYARANESSIADLISLPQNGAYQGYRNTNGDIVISGKLSANAAYWSSSVNGNIPMVMHVWSSYAGYNTTGTDYGYTYTGYQWTYSDSGLQLLESTTGELANVRCIR